MSLRNALRRVANATDPKWAAAVDKEILRLAKAQPTFNSDDIWAALDERHPTVATPEHRAMGPRISKAVRNKTIVLANCTTCGTNKIMQASGREEAHQMDIPVYASLVYKG